MRSQQNTSPFGHLLFQSKNVFIQDERVVKFCRFTNIYEFVCCSLQAVDVEAVAVTVTELVSYALTLNSNNQSWLITQADIYFGKKRQKNKCLLCFITLEMFLNPQSICICATKILFLTEFVSLRTLRTNKKAFQILFRIVEWCA